MEEVPDLDAGGGAECGGDTRQRRESEDDQRDRQRLGQAWPLVPGGEAQDDAGEAEEDQGLGRGEAGDCLVVEGLARGDGADGFGFGEDGAADREAEADLGEAEEDEEEQRDQRRQRPFRARLLETDGEPDAGQDAGRRDCERGPQCRRRQAETVQTRASLERLPARRGSRGR